jgi:4-alpha-glucanotransferase
MRFARAAGVLVHPTSFPSRYGVGDLGDAAYELIDFLVEAKQSAWQVLPLGPTGYADSPYQCFSAFAGNPLLISPDRLVRSGILPPEAVVDVPDFPTHRVDYGPVIEFKRGLLAQAHRRFESKATAIQQLDFEQFCAEHRDWLDDFALFMAVKEYHMAEKGGVWNTWPREIAFREPDGIAHWSEKLAEDVSRHKFLQYLFFEQWLALRAYANGKGIRIIGDVPIFVAFDSADVWANRELFFLDGDGNPTYVAGVPPDYFSETGQRWGNPLYRWNRMAKDGYRWWEARLRATFRQVDIVRVDHFRGFVGYWEIPASEPTAVVGRWVKGPGTKFFRAMRKELGDLPIIAEDLGVITPPVVQLRERFDFPGMKILQFAFGGAQDSGFLPHNYAGSNWMVYTGTHDNETTRGWYENASEKERDYVRRYLGRDGSDIAWDLIRLGYMSVADTVVIPMQDLMNLGNEARMNFPSTESGNWQWRYTAGMLTEGVARGLREFAELYGRAPRTEGTTLPPSNLAEEADVSQGTS